MQFLKLYTYTLLHYYTVMLYYNSIESILCTIYKGTVFTLLLPCLDYIMWS